MRPFRARLSATILSFTVGVGSVWLIGLVPTVGVTLLAKVSPRLVFSPEWRACGNGYSQGYRLLDGREMREGSRGFETAAEALEGFRSEIAKATRVVERVPGFKNGYGAEGERVVMLVSGEAGQEHARILWYGGSNRYYYWLDAPSLEIAVSFEESNAYAY